jgi:hypothetical protein
MAMRTTRKMSEPAKRWMKRTVAFVVTLGSVAGAITALKALWPEPDAPDPQDTAVLSIQVVSDVPLTEFSQRQQLARRLVVQPTDDVPDDPATDTPDCPLLDGCTADTTDAGVEESSADPGTTTEQPPGQRETTTTSPRGIGDQGLQHPAPPGVIHKVCRKLATPCEPAQDVGIGAEGAMEGLGAGNNVDSRGHEVAPDVAAQRILRILRDTRRAANEEPIGAVVNVNAVLGGLRDRPVQLTWSMWHTDGGGRLHGSWLNEHLVYRFVPRTDRDSANVDLWVPLPTAPGPFLVYVYASLDGTRLTSDRSEPFG